MFGPQGIFFFLLLLLVFGGLVVWIALARRAAVRVLAACLAFVPGMVFGVAAVFSGYFAPDKSQVPDNGKVRDVNVFRGYPALALRNTPMEYVMRIPVTASVPQFYLAAGATDHGDVLAAQAFRQELMLRDASVPLAVIGGTGHTALVWRAALSSTLQWMTPQLAQAAAQHAQPHARSQHPGSKHPGSKHSGSKNSRLKTAPIGSSSLASARV